ncbi:hypothetical protein [Legionella gresilensis]|uniref:hypothetical protein n=1 Tax=Legionella gresilensis TaxID=91823 RepID=UPI0010410B29|nr:hypothetical protein [Legionella gresilensis]
MADEKYEKGLKQYKSIDKESESFQKLLKKVQDAGLLVFGQDLARYRKSLIKENPSLTKEKVMNYAMEPDLVGSADYFCLDAAREALQSENNRGKHIK